MPVLFPFAQPIVPATAPRVTDDFVYPSSPVDYKSHWVNAGSVNYATQATGNNAQQGLIRYSVATVAQKGGFISGTQLAFPAPYLLLFGTALQLSALSSVGNRYQVQVGLFDNTLNSVNGFGFRYQDDINGGKWQCFGDASTFDSGEGATTTVNKFRIWCNGPGLPVLFMVNDRIVGALTAPIFPGNLWAGVTIEKISGVSTRTMDCDYAGIYWTRNDVSL